MRTLLFSACCCGCSFDARFKLLRLVERLKRLVDEYSLLTDDADEDDERLLVLTASGERLRLDGGERFEHSPDEDDEVDSLRVGLPMTPDE